MPFGNHGGEAELTSQVASHFLARLWRHLRRLFIHRKARSRKYQQRLSKAYQRRFRKHAN